MLLGVGTGHWRDQARRQDRTSSRLTRDHPRLPLVPPTSSLSAATGIVLDKLTPSHGVCPASLARCSSY